jgi:hypothetical protein
MEAAFLRFVRELKPGDLLGGGRSRDEEVLAVLDGQKAELEGRIARAKARLDAAGDVEALLDLLVKWDGELKEVKTKREELAARLATNETEALEGAQGLLDRLRGAAGKERAELRERLKARIRQLVKGVWVLTWDVTPTVRAAEVQVCLRGGNVRALLVAWCRGGKYPGLSVGIGCLVGRPGNDAHLADKRLSDYRTDLLVREFYQRHHDTIRPAVLEAIAAEAEVRRAMAECDKHAGENNLEEYLAEGTLDGCRPPVRTGRPPRGLPSKGSL